jgi:thiol-disulfide isomerase/thioredoxin
MEVQMKSKILATLITVSIFLAACSPAAPTVEVMMEKPTDAMMEKPTDAMMEKPTDAMMDKPNDAMMDKPTDAMMETHSPEMMVPKFFEASLTNVNTGDSFKISDFSGKVVLVENLAMWCPNCKKQQEQVKILHEMLGMDSGLVSIGLDVDLNEDPADLKKYTDSNGFDWFYAIPPQEVLTEISNLYGANFLNPPSTPIFVIDRKGGIHPMPFGVKSADDLKEYIDPFLSEGM